MCGKDSGGRWRIGIFRCIESLPGRKFKCTKGCFDHNGLTYIIMGDAPGGCSLRRARCVISDTEITSITIFIHGKMTMESVGDIRFATAGCIPSSRSYFSIRFLRRSITGRFERAYRLSGWRLPERQGRFACRKSRLRLARNRQKDVKP